MFGLLEFAWKIGIDFTMPIMTILNTGDPVKDDPFNYFFSLMAAVGFLIIIVVAICGVVRESLRS